MFRKDQILISKRLTLRPPCEVDVEDMARFINDDAILRTTAQVPAPCSKCDVEEIFINAKNRWVREDGEIFSIIKERFIGTIGLKHSEQGSILGYWLAKPYWGQGLMSEAMAKILAYGFNTLNLETIRADVFKDNPASLHLLKKFGFEVIGEAEAYSRARDEVISGYQTQLKRNQYIQSNEDIYA